MENKDDIPKFASVTKESLEGKDGESASAPAAVAPAAELPAVPPAAVRPLHRDSVRSCRLLPMPYSCP